MMDYIVALADQLGIPRARLVAVHADLGEMEWPGTRELAAEHAAHYGLRFEVVHKRDAQGERQDLLQQVRLRKKWPSSTCRYCTSDHKRGPVRTLLTRLAAETRATGKMTPALIVNAMGLRADESPARAKKPSWIFDDSASNGRRDVWTWLPLHAWTEAEVWARIATAGTRSHSAYRRVSRLSCMFCIFSPREALAIAGQENPALLERYVAVEKEIGHKFRVSLSLVDVVKDVVSGNVPERSAGAWCM
jgi:3'-phosphoadenosine 5'-phosphosulfate sulfotransferase (PAPS reductase)/FAD synthetase